MEPAPLKGRFFVLITGRTHGELDSLEIENELILFE